MGYRELLLFHNFKWHKYSEKKYFTVYRENGNEYMYMYVYDIYLYIRKGT